MDLHRVIALLLSPVTVAAISSLGVYAMYPDPLGLIVALLLIVICPVANVVKKSLSGEMDILVPDRYARGPFFVQAIACYSVATVVLAMLDSCPLAVLSLSYLAVTLAIALINHYFTKVSVHMAGLAGPAAFLIILGNHALGGLLMALVPVLAWSRWRSRSHTPVQILLGVVISVLITSVTCFMALNLK